ncbi:hypothetical protein S349_57 [Shewanella sp. phage 3/49]|uniref:hypothetical protein n=1 Tax=Shewanella sp. phage 3/49 TaxID=1458863 RepID=UPI0004F5B338|nr:hypothetical protein S349_57 [Shewanella sp. phage 3/49]AHK11847.1 hypothetical protein S349_57 [Shewanella sp. phage 3/49]
MLRDLAEQFGHSTFIGTPCRTCDNKVRMVNERYHCIECHRKQSKKYNRLNMVERNEKTRNWAIANAEYIKNARLSLKNNKIGA